MGRRSCGSFVGPVIGRIANPTHLGYLLGSLWRRYWNPSRCLSFWSSSVCARWSPRPTTRSARSWPVRARNCWSLCRSGPVLWLAARAIRSHVKYRRTGLEWGFLLVAIAAVVSCVFAGNKRLAVNATVDWLAMPVLAITLTQLVRRAWQVRLTLCVVLASAVANAGQCLEQKLFSFEETRRLYFEHRQEIWERQGVSLDSPQVEAYERRLEAREASGYTWHSNVAGAYLVL